MIVLVGLLVCVAAAKVIHNWEASGKIGDRPGRAWGGPLLHAADVAVEPSNDFLDDLAALRHEDLVPAGIEHVLLVRAWRAQCLEQGPLRRLKGKDEVLVAVQHQDLNSHAGRKGERIGYT